MKNEFVSTVSHELRTPLTSIKGYVDLILDGDAGEINEIQREFLGIVKENSDRLVELINDMLDISRIESGRIHLKIEPLDIARRRSRAPSTPSARCSRRPAATVEGQRDARDLPLVAADRDRVGQVLINLISNAIKYSPGGRRRHRHCQARRRTPCRSRSRDQGLGHQPRRTRSSCSRSSTGSTPR